MNFSVENEKSETRKRLKNEKSEKRKRLKKEKQETKDMLEELMALNEQFELQERAKESILHEINLIERNVQQYFQDLALTDATFTPERQRAFFHQFCRDFAVLNEGVTPEQQQAQILFQQFSRKLALIYETVIPEEQPDLLQQFSRL